jgi:hypothetical protein
MSSASHLKIKPADGSTNLSDFVIVVERVNDRREIEVDDIKKPLLIGWFVWAARLDGLAYFIRLGK